MGVDVAENLFERHGDDVHLVAGRMRDSGALVFPMPTGPEAARADPELLAPDGMVWSWTIQRFCPKPPYDGASGDDFRPYGVVYVQLGDALIVEGRVAAATDLSALKIGLPMRVVVERYADGVDTYAFAPIEEHRR